MFAYISKLNEQGKTSVGTSGNYISNNYVSMQTFLAFAFRYIPDGDYELQFYHNGDSGYGKPFRTAYARKSNYRTFLIDKPDTVSIAG